MRNSILVVILLLWVTSIFAQKTDLTLEEAVMGQWRQFYPSQPANLQWIPNQESFTFLNEDRTFMMSQEVGDKNAKKALSLEQLQSDLGLEFKYFPSIEWKTENSFSFSYAGVHYVANYENKKIKIQQKTELPKGNNLDRHDKTARIAYTDQHNLYIQDEEGKRLEVFATNDKNIVSGQAIARHEFGISKGTFWSPDGQYLAFYQKNEIDVTDYPLLDINTTPANLNTIKYPMAGQRSEYAKIGVYDVRKKEVIMLKIDGPKDQYLTNLAWGPKNKMLYVAIVNREQNWMQLCQYDARSGELVKVLFEEKHDKYVEPENPVWFLPNNSNEFLWRSERDGFKHLYRYNIEGKLLGQVTSGKWVVLDVLGLDKSEKNVLVTGTDESGLNTTLYNAPLGGNKSVTKMVEKEGQHTFMVASSGNYILDGFSNLETPYELHLLAKNGTAKQLLYKAKDPYTEKTIATTTFQTIKGEGGVNLNTRLIKPANFDPKKKYPVIVYVYGGPQAQMITNSWLGGASLWMHYAANQGYLVFTLDNRGSANRGFEFENCIHRNLGELEMKDQMTGVEYLKTLPYADTERMAVHGWSYGGFMTTSMMLKYPDVFKVGVAGGPVTNWAYYEIMYGERYMDMPHENEEGYKKTTLANFTDQLKGDLLLIHGTVDDVVVMQHSFSLVKSFVDNGILVDFFPYPMHPHNVRGKDRVHLMHKVLHYIDEKIKQ